MENLKPTKETNQPDWLREFIHEHPTNPLMNVIHSTIWLRSELKFVNTQYLCKR